MTEPKPAQDKQDTAFELTTLQRVILPNQATYGPVESYFRWESGAAVESPHGLSLDPGSQVSTLTFYNAFPIVKWHDYTTVSSARAYLRGTGSCRVQQLVARVTGLPAGVPKLDSPLVDWPVEEQLLSDTTIDLLETEDTVLPEVNLASLGEGLLFLRIVANEDVLISSMGFATIEPPGQSARVGLVITHFNRQQQVQAASHRIREELLDDPEFGSLFELIVVDNSSNSEVESGNGVHVIPNANYGGSGGFSRGLLELYRNGGFTHCLFMDDDASCEIESLRRVSRIFSFSTTDRLAVAGSLMDAADQGRVYEKGAYFDGLCHRVHQDLDTRLPFHLLMAERDVFPANYGGWWFFGFSLADVARFPFPFFVRGDDVAFSISNSFNILTMNGIAAYGDTFESKHGTMTTYLDTRGHLVQQIAVLGQGRLKVLKGFARFFLMTLLSYRYGSAAATCQAARDVMQGPQFFADNLDMSSRFPLIKELAQADAGAPYKQPPADLAIVEKSSESLPSIVARVITMNGVLLPNFLLRKQPVLQKPGFKARLKEVYLHRSIFYAPSPTSAGEKVELDRMKMFALTLEFLRDFTRFAIHFGRVRKSYREQVPYLTSRQFWEKTYGLTEHDDPARSN
jgi:galactofuranosylgalactofuranosylrhamnosyl-N-acetylglucosaminyl-diphospho-decaprenol beta-1,5/1,6-galactofuranosyltransferase